MSHLTASALDQLPTFNQAEGEEADSIHVVVETPQGSLHKFNYDPALGLFRLGKVMPTGSVFPFDFGFVPSTRAEDGDPLDVLVLMDAPVFCGCLVDARLVGVLEAEQSKGESKATIRNDRLLAVATHSRRHRDVRTLADLPAAHLEEVEHFFCSYNAQAGKGFRVLGRGGSERAQTLVRAAVERFGKG